MSASSPDIEVIDVDDDDEVQEIPPTDPMQCVFEWRVRNFSRCHPEPDEGLCSPIFSDSAGDRWFLTAYPGGERDYEEHLSVHVAPNSVHQQQQRRGLQGKKVFCEVAIVDSESGRWASAEGVRDREELGRFEFKTLVLREELRRAAEKVMPGDVLTVCCMLCDYEEVQPRPTARQLRGNAQLRKFADDFRALFRSGKFSDLTLNTRDGPLTAHRVVLTARSAEFRRRLGAPASELRVPDFGKATMEALLSYIYTGEVDAECKVLPLDLYQAAKRFEMAELERAISPTRVFAQTEVVVEKYTYEWRLGNFADANSGRPVYSGKFHTGPNELWNLSLQLPQQGENDDIGVYLNKLWRVSEKKPLLVRFQIYVLDRDKQRRFNTALEWGFRQTIRHGTPRFLKRDVLARNADELLPGGALTVCCEMSVSDTGHLSQITHSQSSSTTPLSEISDIRDVSRCMGGLLESGEFADVTVKCAGKSSFKLHKAVLCARSPKFVRFFETQDVGLDHFTIDVTGISRLTLERLFRLVYRGEVQEMAENSAAEELYTAAKYYEISEARDAFAHYLRSSLTTDTAFHMLTLSSAIEEDPALKTTVLDFICSHAEELISGRNRQWAAFESEHPSAATEVMRYLVNGYRAAKRRRES